MTATTMLKELEALGSESYKRVLLNHGAKEPCFGVKIEFLKQIQKRVSKDHPFALALYDTGVYDAKYLAGLIADDARMQREDLQRWVEQADEPLAGSVVAWVAAGSPHGWELALEWIAAGDELVAAAGWSTLASLVSIKNDAELDLARLEALLRHIGRGIHQEPDVVRAKMNGFVIAVGSYVKALTDLALCLAEEIGPVTVDVGNTDCRVPYAPDYIRKVAQRGALGRKRKTAKC